MRFRDRAVCEPARLLRGDAGIVRPPPQRARENPGQPEHLRSPPRRVEGAQPAQRGAEDPSARRVRRDMVPFAQPGQDLAREQILQCLRVPPAAGEIELTGHAVFIHALGRGRHRCHDHRLDRPCIHEFIERFGQPPPRHGLPIERNEERVRLHPGGIIARRQIHRHPARPQPAHRERCAMDGHCAICRSSPPP